MLKGSNEDIEIPSSRAIYMKVIDFIT